MEYRSKDNTAVNSPFAVIRQVSSLLIAPITHNR